MKIETTTTDSYPALVLRGDFETDAVPEFLTVVDDLRAGGAKSLMVSFRYVKYINSTALGAVVRVASACKQAGGDFAVLQPSRLSREVITKMGLDGVLPCFDDEAQAIAFLGGKGASVAATGPAKAAESRAETTVMFSFDDERAQKIPGKGRRHGVAALVSVDDKGLVFRWEPARHGSDAATAAVLFPTGGKMRNKMQLKLMQKGFVEAEATVGNLVLDDDGNAIVTALWSDIGQAERAALARYREDLDYLREQASGGEAAE